MKFPKFKRLIHPSRFERKRIRDGDEIKVASDASPNVKGFLPALNFENEASLLVSDWMNLSRHNQYTLQCIGDENNQHRRGNEREVLVYLIRHGEAEHNILEKKAMKAARQSSLQIDGLPENHPETKRRVDEARKSVLNDESLRDARLSDLGRREAEAARRTLHKMIQEHSVGESPELSTPSYILVSPLTRTLETADILFPGHCEIHVRDDLEERRTGKPPDTRSSVATLGKRTSFQRFSMNELSRKSMQNIALYEDETDSNGRRSSISTETSSTDHSSGSYQDPEVLVMRGDLCHKTIQKGYRLTEEDKTALRKRTERLFVLLGETDQKSVAVVTHKGYLRELERGPLGQTDAKEFQNCEIRAYRVIVSLIDHRLVRAERVR